MFKVDNKDRVMCKLFSTLVMTTLELSSQRHLPVVVIVVEKAHTYLSRLCLRGNQHDVPGRIF